MSFFKHAHRLYLLLHQVETSNYQNIYSDNTGLAENLTALCHCWLQPQLALQVPSTVVKIRSHIPDQGLCALLLASHLVINKSKQPLQQSRRNHRENRQKCYALQVPMESGKNFNWKITQFSLIPNLNKLFSRKAFSVSRKQKHRAALEAVGL